MSRISPPDITQDALARSPAPARIAADKTSQAEFEQALSNKPDAAEKRRPESLRKHDIRDLGKLARDSSRLPGDDTEPAEQPAAADRETIAPAHVMVMAPQTDAPDEKATTDEPDEKPETDNPEVPVVSPETDRPQPLPTPTPTPTPTPQPHAGAVAAQPQPQPTDHPKTSTHHRDSVALTAKTAEQSLPVMLGATATGSAPETPSDQHNASGEHDEPPPFGSPVEDPKPSATAGQTPGDKLLARLQSTTEQPQFSKDLGQLVQTLQLHIHAGVSRDGSTTLLQVNLAQLGQVDVQLAHSRGHLHIEIQANPGSLLQLQLARGELMERLQRLNPGQPIELSFAQHHHGGDQGSRQRRHVYDEWEQDS